MSTYPPDGWYVGSGTWGTDMDRETSTVLTGGNSIKFKNTTPAADPYMYSELIPVETGMPYSAKVNVRADSIAAGNTIAFKVEWYQSNGTTLISTDTVHNAVLGAADTWYTLKGIYNAPALACYCKLRIEKNNTAFNAYFDLIRIDQHPHAFSAYVAAQTITSGAGDVQINFTNEDYDYGDVFNLTTDEFVAKIAGVYMFQVRIGTESINADTEYNLSLRIDGASVAIDRRAMSIAMFGNMTISSINYLSIGSYARVYFAHNHGSNRDVEVYFRGALVEY